MRKNRLLDLTLLIRVSLVVTTLDAAVTLADCAGTADCNGNGVSDDCDISSGVSQDCDLNGIPDECLGEQVLLFEDFSSLTISSSTWSEIITVKVSTLGIAPPSPPYSLRIDNQPLAEHDAIVSQPIDTSAFEQLRLEYHWQRTGLADEPDLGDNLIVEYRSLYDNWVEIDQHLGMAPDMVVFEFNSIALPEDARHDNFQVRFRTTAEHGGSANTKDYFIDDIRVVALTASDCNDNGIPDSCDITAGALDMDGNAVPDSCQSTIQVPADIATIQDAVNHAEHGDTIVVADGVYSGPGNRDIDLLGKRITLRSANGADSCTIDAGGTVGDRHRGFHLRQFETHETVIEGFTITNGFYENQYGTSDRELGGAGMLLYHSSPTIRNCVIRDNNTFGSYGVGIHFRYSAARIIGGAIIGNVGVIESSPYKFKANGAAAYAERSNLSFEGMVFVNNTSDGFGGAIFSDESDLLLSHCTFHGNHGSNGGALYMRRNSTAELSYCLVAGNSANKHGGGIYAVEGQLTINHSTIADNAAVQKGGGLFLNLQSETAVGHTILWGNQATPASQIRNQQGSVLEVEYSLIQDGESGVSGPATQLQWLAGNLQEDPQFTSALSGDYHLGVDSPAIDAGNPQLNPAEAQQDLDGDSVIIGSAVDIGVDETTSLFVSAPDPGIAGVNNQITISGGVGASNLYVIISEESSLTAWPICDDVFASIGLDNATVLTPAFNPLGQAFIRGEIPVSMQGKMLFIQAIDPLRCRVSNPMVFTFE